MMMMCETSKHVPKTEKRCCVFKGNCFIFADKTVKCKRAVEEQPKSLKTPSDLMLLYKSLGYN